MKTAYEAAWNAYQEALKDIDGTQLTLKNGEKAIFAKEVARGFHDTRHAKGLVPR